MKEKTIEFLSSITGISTITAATLLATKKYDLAAILFAALSLGVVGVLWERYSRKAGAPLNIKAFAKKGIPDKDEVEFLAVHSPQIILAATAYFLSKRNRQSKSGLSLNN
jgi:hypothetical protein